MKGGRLYMAMIRREPCIVRRFGHCRGQIEANHMRHGGNAGIGGKPGDEHCLPFCNGHHEEYHRIGHHNFLEKYELTEVAIEREKVRHLTEFTDTLAALLAGALAK